MQRTITLIGELREERPGRGSRAAPRRLPRPARRLSYSGSRANRPAIHPACQARSSSLVVRAAGFDQRQPGRDHNNLDGRDGSGRVRAPPLGAPALRVAAPTLDAFARPRISVVPFHHLAESRPRLATSMRSSSRIVPSSSATQSSSSSQCAGSRSRQAWIPLREGTVALGPTTRPPASVAAVQASMPGVEELVGEQATVPSSCGRPRRPHPHRRVDRLLRVLPSAGSCRASGRSTSGRGRRRRVLLEPEPLRNRKPVLDVVGDEAHELAARDDRRPHGAQR